MRVPFDLCIKSSLLIELESVLLVHTQGRRKLNCRSRQNPAVLPPLSQLNTILKMHVKDWRMLIDTTALK